MSNRQRQKDKARKRRGQTAKYNKLVDKRVQQKMKDMGIIRR